MDLRRPIRPFLDLVGPALPALVALVLAAPTRPASAAPVGEEAVLLDLLNAEREAIGLRRLEWNDRLADLARQHAEDVSRAGVASHHSSGDGADYGERLGRAGMFTEAFAENVALGGDELEAHVMTLDSARRRHVVERSFTHVGIGVARSSDGVTLFVVEDFATLPEPPSSRDAEHAVRTAITRLSLRSSGLPLEADRLSESARRMAGRMAEMDGAEPPEAPGVADVAIFYTTLDAEQLPQTLRDLAPLAREFGLGVACRHAPSHESGTCFVAVLLRGLG